MSVKIADDITSAIASVHEDKSDANWVLVGYEDRDSLKLLGTGSGGLEELKSHLLAKDVCYGLLRERFTFEKVGNISTDTVKFVFVYWRPEGIPIFRKMKMGIFEGQIKNLFKPYHADLEVESLEEVSAEAVSKLLDRVTMRTATTGGGASAPSPARPSMGSPVQSIFRSSSGRTSPKSSAGQSSSESRPPVRRQGSFKTAPTLSFVNEEDIKNTIASIRNDRDENSWLVIRYKSKSELELHGKGTGTVTEMVQSFEAGNVNYGFFRTIEQYDKSRTVKFGFVVWQPEGISPMMKAAMTTHKGAVTGLFRPYHVDFHISSKDELDEGVVADEVGAVTGTRSSVVEGMTGDFRSSFTLSAASEGRTRAASAAPSSTLPDGTARLRAASAAPPSSSLGNAKHQDGLVVAEEEELRQAVGAVRNANDPTDWVAVAFEGRTMRIAGKGSGGVQELRDSLIDGQIQYALLRTVEVIDQSRTIKFCLIHWQPETVPVTAKGQLGTLSGAIHSHLRPYHGDIFVDKREELTEDAVAKAVSNLRSQK